ncbi:branched-chain amino acid aminotransferase II [Sistotremastrum niveocremeum HHB9708]|uniref:branched-chain-amino-acid transaminase n=2 Tax=Sistotremastraceae TaxID=3402574 RepID=A0A164XBZ3_9AGAM|nr:branched-chain amino acid aminotransferase II [Sistotremastrum niveocremeum HHB9708]KZT36608.1 branched-chain amino acid aminotransferase II [Sistotremastrum suecicum HHB10207 ss-3]
MTGLATALPDIEPARLVFTRNSNPKPPPESSKLVWGRIFTDHMLMIKWNALSGWADPHILPYGPLSLEPSSSVLHYAQTIFEGLKAYRDEDGKITLFRPDMNMKRMNRSAARIALPGFDGDALQKLIMKLIEIDAHWVPQLPGHSLYIRPTLIGNQPTLGVAPPTDALLFVICSPVGPYYPNGFKPVSLYGTTEFVRAAPGGTGSYKLGVNYAPGIIPQKLAAKQGYAQNLWLWGPDHLLTEVGTMNVLAVFKKDDGSIELATPPLEDVILPGITRDSVLELARAHASGSLSLDGLPKNFTVTERPISMKEVKAASENGTLVEIFGAGTAAVITTVDRIGYLGEDVIVPVGEDGLGPVSRVILREITGRQIGKIPSSWSVVVKE